MRICKVVLLVVGLIAFVYLAHCVELDSLCEQFLQVSNWEDIASLLENKMAAGDPDMLRIGRYLNSTDLQAIIDHMWEQQEFDQVKSFHDNHMSFHGKQSIKTTWFNLFLVLQMDS